MIRRALLMAMLASLCIALVVARGPVQAQGLVHVSVQSAMAVTLRNPSGREWAQGPGPSGYAVLSVPYQAGEWRLSTAGCQRITGPGRWDGCGLWITLPPSGSVGGYVVVMPTATVEPAITTTMTPTPFPSMTVTEDMPPTLTPLPSMTPTPHDSPWGINVPPAPPGYVWVLVVIERGDGHRMLASKALVAVEDMRGFLGARSERVGE